MKLKSAAKCHNRHENILLLCPEVHQGDAANWKEPNMRIEQGATYHQDQHKQPHNQAGRNRGNSSGSSTSTIRTSSSSRSCTNSNSNNKVWGAQGVQMSVKWAPGTVQVNASRYEGCVEGGLTCMVGYEQAPGMVQVSVSRYEGCGGGTNLHRGVWMSAGGCKHSRGSSKGYVPLVPHPPPPNFFWIFLYYVEIFSYFMYMHLQYFNEK